MQICSKEYKEQMRKPFRNLSFIRVNLGIIHQEAQSNAKTVNLADYEYFSNTEKLFDNYDVEVPYATLEQGFSRVDDTMSFMPRQSSSELYFNQGIVSKNKKIKFVFDKAYDIKGLTIDFSKYYPVSFDIVTNNKTVNVRSNDKSLFTTQEIFNSTEFIEIKAYSMLNPNSRLRLNKAIMGIGVFFDNKDIISANKKEHVSPIMENLHTLDFSMQADNKNRNFDVENSVSSVNFLELGQKLDVSYGYKLESGRVEWIKGCTMKLRSWSCDDKILNLSASDVFDDLNEKYYRGKYYQDGVSLYELALDVLKDALIDSREYSISNYLKKVTVNNPIPVVSHKEALQLIANAGRCLLYQDRDGKIVIRPYFKPAMRVEYTGAVNESSNNLLNSEVKNYALLNKGYTRVDDSMYFLSKPVPDNVDMAYISNGSGTKKINVNFEAECTFFNINLSFKGVAPNRLKIKTYRDNVLVDDFYKEDVELECSIMHHFLDITRIEVEFEELSYGTRVVLNKLYLGDRTDYIFEYSKNLKDYPKGNLLPKLKTFNMHRNLYLESGEKEKEILKDNINQTKTSVYTYYFSNPTYNIRFETLMGLSNNQVRIVYSSSFCVKLEISGSAVGELKIFAKEYLISKQTDTLEVNTTGEVKKWDNPLISSQEHATLVAGWVLEYLKSDIEYILSDRGEPRIDAGDISFLEHRHLGNVEIKILDYTINFNGALSGNVKARKVGAYVD